MIAVKIVISRRKREKDGCKTVRNNERKILKEKMMLKGELKKRKYDKGRKEGRN